MSKVNKIFNKFIKLKKLSEVKIISYLFANDYHNEQLTKERPIEVTFLAKELSLSRVQVSNSVKDLVNLGLVTKIRAKNERRIVLFLNLDNF